MDGCRRRREGNTRAHMVCLSRRGTQKMKHSKRGKRGAAPPPLNDYHIGFSCRDTVGASFFNSTRCSIHWGCSWGYWCLGSLVKYRAGGQRCVNYTEVSAAEALILGWHCGGGSEKFSVLCRYVKPDIQGTLLSPFAPSTMFKCKRSQ